MKKPAKPRRSLPVPKATPLFVAPYLPSWVDRFTAFVDRLPGPPWAYYAAMGVTLYLATAAVQWGSGAYPVGLLSRGHAVGAFLTPYALGLMHYLDRVAATAIKSFRPALRGGENTYHRLAYIFTTLPSRLAVAGGLLIGLAGLMLAGGAAYLLPSTPSLASAEGGRDVLSVLNRGFVALFEVGPTPASYGVTLAVLALNWWTGGTLVLHTIRRLILVARIYKRHTNVDLFRQGPLYALSRLTAQTTIGAVFVVYSIATVPTYMATRVGYVTVAMIVVLAFASFALPLFGIHRVLVSEKDRLLEGISDRLRSSGAELHRRIDQNLYRGIDELNKALAGLEIERNMIAAMPTWPWQPDTLRTFLIALLLPVVVWVTQVLLQRVLLP